jgi:hypothetical protein
MTQRGDLPVLRRRRELLYHVWAARGRDLRGDGRGFLLLHVPLLHARRHLRSGGLHRDRAAVHHEALQHQGQKQPSLLADGVALLLRARSAPHFASGEARGGRRGEGRGGKPTHRGHNAARGRVAYFRAVLARVYLRVLKYEAAKARNANGEPGPTQSRAL